MTKKVIFFLTGLIILSFISSCGIYAPSDARKVSPNSKERVKKNLEEGKGISLGKMMKGGVEQAINLQALIRCGGQH